VPNVLFNDYLHKYHIIMHGLLHKCCLRAYS